MRISLIDSDSLCYSSSKETIEQSVEIIKEKINNILIQTECDYFSLFISKGRYFRHSIDSNYKLGRKSSPTQLKYIKTLKSFLQEEYKANWMEGCEADDTCAFWVRTPLYLDNENNLTTEVTENRLQPILCAIDKDLLFSIPSSKGINGHFNYSYKLLEKENPESIVKGTWIETTEEEANSFRLRQLIIGDASDSILTPFPESAGEWFVKNNMNFMDVVSAYINGFNYKTFTGKDKFVKGFGIAQGLYELQKNFRLLKLLDTEADYLQELGRLPELPTILKTQDYIKTETKEYKDLF